MKRVFFNLTLAILAAFIFTGCMETMVQPTATTDTGLAMQLPPYSGPKAKVAIADFEWKVGENTGTTTTITGMGSSPIRISQSQSSANLSGLRDMLTTAMVQTKRFRVLERVNLGSLQKEMALSKQGYTDKSGIRKGGIKGADLLVMGAVTGWEPGTSGGQGNLGGAFGGLLSSLSAGFKKSSMAMDIRIVDTHTSEVLAATRVEGVAKDVNFGAMADIFGGSSLSGGLGMYAKTPMEKAIRICIYNAVKFITENTPREYMKY